MTNEVRDNIIMHTYFVEYIYIFPHAYNKQLHVSWTENIIFSTVSTINRNYVLNWK